jgi:hypothetical protein
MSELLAPFGTPPEVEPADVVEAPPRTPVLITEQQVLFATAAASPSQLVRTRRRGLDAMRALAASVTALFATSASGTHPKPRHYPPRHDFLEDSRMAREMLRL